MVVPLPESYRPLRRVEYDKLIELGVFGDERIELLDGVLVPMSPIGPRHSSAIDMLTLILVRALGDRARIRVQNPFAVSDISEPEPELLVAPLADYLTEHPTDALLVIEVAESSLAQDRGRKLRIYAAGGNFTSTRVVERGEDIALVAFPDVRVAVSDVLR